MPTPVVVSHARDHCPWWRIAVSPNRGHKGDKNEIMRGVYVWVWRTFQVPNPEHSGAPMSDTGDWLRPKLDVLGIEGHDELPANHIPVRNVILYDILYTFDHLILLSSLLLVR
jgi:hypothetical protein